MADQREGRGRECDSVLISAACRVPLKLLGMWPVKLAACSSEDCLYAQNCYWAAVKLAKWSVRGMEPLGQYWFPSDCEPNPKGLIAIGLCVPLDKSVAIVPVSTFANPKRREHWCWAATSERHALVPRRRTAGTPAAPANGKVGHVRGVGTALCWHWAILLANRHALPIPKKAYLLSVSLTLPLTQADQWSSLNSRWLLSRWRRTFGNITMQGMLHKGLPDDVCSILMISESDCSFFSMSFIRSKGIARLRGPKW